MKDFVITNNSLRSKTKQRSISAVQALRVVLANSEIMPSSLLGPFMIRESGSYIVKLYIADESGSLLYKGEKDLRCDDTLIWDIPKSEYY